MSYFTPLLRRFAKDESGVFAVLFGLMAVVLIALGGATVDYVTLEQARQRAQVALDAAVLALQQDIYDEDVTTEDIRASAEAIVLERIGDIDIIEAKVDQISVNHEEGRLSLGGSILLPTIFVRLVGVTQLGAAFSAEAVRGSVNMEVALALDVTGSMGGQRIKDLKASTYELVETLLASNQGEVTSRVAIVPYSQAVNAGDYAEKLRGPIRERKNIASIKWYSGNTKYIDEAYDQKPVRIKSNNHGLKDGDWVYIWGVDDMHQINDRAFKVKYDSKNYFYLVDTNGNHYNEGEGGYILKCLVANCDAVVTSSAHGYANGDKLYFEDAKGITDFNNRLLTISDVTNDSFVLPGASFDRSKTHTANTGKFVCTWQNATEGCYYYRFQNIYNDWRMNVRTTCVTERATTPVSDLAPNAGGYVGRNYPEPGNGCLGSKIVPLTTDETKLDAAIDGFVATGSTAGNLGILWAWYMLSPNFGYVWPGSEPEPYDTPQLLKAAIIMTDGEFNTVHYDGVVARNSTSGSSVAWNNADYIGQVAHNGDAYDQARASCDAMKATGIVVYTVGFGLSAGTAAANVMNYCASGPDKAYLAEDGEALKQSFAQIAENISALRITR